MILTASRGKQSSIIPREKVGILNMAKSKTQTGEQEGVRAVDDDFIPSLEKGLAVLELFGSDNPDWTLSQIARELKLTPGTTRRILRTLEKLGYAVADEGRFCLTPRVLKLGFSYLSSQPFAAIAKPLLTQLARRLNATCCITVLDERDVVYIARGTHKPIEPFYVHVGARLPAYATAPGKVLLAGLAPDVLDERLIGWDFQSFTPNTLSSAAALKADVKEARSKGYALNDQEIFLGQRSIAVPLSLGGVQAASIVAAASVSSASLDRLVADLLGPLQEAAIEIEQAASSLL
ncbi:MULTISPECIES: IclR family transcriptional regulator C-terminal domain-containing protein [unclassified Sphingobium]|uniref:IclR family transcriptional regulator domain-containing protein n=2 Tax=unclassified Sphingobium TaxID=2611147 RepID=UPI002223F287|nr:MULTISPECIES: IclR family transcriptional regulator C-terminal domain-containing protein [unclassified Sphingobium]MCW2412702.1 IclR family pca regulon transcriptional regulator [Sphingobium sp. B8D3D]MCW2415000.1 IclR family pca regulon transcriptional regulator [Sphingobium sp. B8D3A]